MIRLTKQADYGIVLMAHVARGGERWEQFNAKQLAEETQLAAPMVSKILKSLCKSGLLVSTRGAAGGYRLGREAEDISVADVVRALEGPIALTECVDLAESDCGIELSCPVRSNWRRINDAVTHALSQVKISELGCSPCHPAQSIHLEIPEEHHEPALVG